VLAPHVRSVRSSEREVDREEGAPSWHTVCRQLTMEVVVLRSDWAVDPTLAGSPLPWIADDIGY
jgi:hypothetical protein